MATSLDPVVKLMRKAGIPVDREHYLEVAYMGAPPKELSAEEEQGLPPQLQQRAEK